MIVFFQFFFLSFFLFSLISILRKAFLILLLRCFNVKHKKKIVLINLKSYTSNWLKMLSYPWKFHETGPAYYSISAKRCTKSYENARVQTDIDMITHSLCIQAYAYYMYTQTNTHRLNLCRKSERVSTRGRASERARKREIDG